MADVVFALMIAISLETGKKGMAFEWSATSSPIYGSASVLPTIS